MQNVNRNFRYFLGDFLGVGWGRQKKSKYALNVWRMCCLDIPLMNPVSLLVETWLLVSLGVSL